MIRGIYTAATGMLSAQIQSEVIGDNVVNLKTAGFKEQLASNIAFPTREIQRVTDNDSSQGAAIGRMGSGLGVDRLALTDVQGPLQTTGINTDLALTSAGYFAVQTPEGERYTRNGHFQRNSQGILQTAEGYPLLGENGPLGPLSGDFTVKADRTVVDQNQNRDRLRIVEIPAEALRREGQSLYSAAQPVQAAAGAQVKQKTIEESNVDLSGQLVQMMSVMKAYEANQRVIQTQDELLGKAVNEIGKI